jgi:hypothetical protein
MGDPMETAIFPKISRSENRLAGHIPLRSLPGYTILSRYDLRLRSHIVLGVRSFS